LRHAASSWRRAATSRTPRASRTFPKRIEIRQALIVAGICGLVGFLADDSLVAISALVLCAGLRLVWTDDGMYVLPAAYAFHWMETSLGLFYRGLTGRETTAFYSSDYKPMVLIALGCCLAIAIGIRIGLTLSKRAPDEDSRPAFAFSLGALATAYLITISFEGTLNSIAASYPTIRQILVTADTARLGLLFLLLRRLVHPSPRWIWISGILAVEIGLGLTGFFAGFREPLVLAALAFVEIFDRRNVRHWLAVSAAAACAVVLGMLWMAVRGDYRKNFVAVDNFNASRSARFQNIESLTKEWLSGDRDAIWESADSLVDRMWTVYYPALAVARVPRLIPHTNGSILYAGLVHIVTPRVLFPDKPDLPSDSDKVRTYSGVMVAGVEQETTIAFGYAAESYVDFGVPLMFLPLLLFGCALGALYGLFRRLITYRDLLVAFATVAFWLSLYLFERSWAMMIGVSLGMMIYLGIPVVLLDRVLVARAARRAFMMQPGMYSDEQVSPVA
jgi:hypothetical protein